MARATGTRLGLLLAVALCGGGCRSCGYYMQGGGGLLVTPTEGHSGDTLEPAASWNLGTGWVAPKRRSYDSYSSSYSSQPTQGSADDGHLGLTWGFGTEYMEAGPDDTLGNDSIGALLRVWSNSIGLHYRVTDWLMASFGAEIGVSSLSFPHIEGFDQSVLLGAAAAGTFYFARPEMEGDKRGIFLRVQVRAYETWHTSGPYVFVPITGALGLEL